MASGAPLRAWLLEIQVNPGLKHRDPAKRRIIPPLLGESVRIALEVRERGLRGSSLARLDGIERFRWVINDAAASRGDLGVRPAGPSRAREGRPVRAKSPGGETFPYG